MNPMIIPAVAVNDVLVPDCHSFSMFVALIALTGPMGQIWRHHEASI